MMQALRQSRLLESVDRSNHRILDWNGLARTGDFDPGYLHLTDRPIAQPA
jgi:hypothetical protein